MEDLIKYLRGRYGISVQDLRLSNDDRVALIAKIELIEEIEDILRKGYPDDSK